MKPARHVRALLQPVRLQRAFERFAVPAIDAVIDHRGCDVLSMGEVEPLGRRFVGDNQHHFGGKALVLRCFDQRHHVGAASRD